MRISSRNDQINSTQKKTKKKRQNLYLFNYIWLSWDKRMISNVRDISKFPCVACILADFQRNLLIFFILTSERRRYLTLVLITTYFKVTIKLNEEASQSFKMLVVLFTTSWNFVWVYRYLLFSLSQIDNIILKGARVV